jgi:hypothetical protein
MFRVCGAEVSFGSAVRGSTAPHAPAAHDSSCVWLNIELDRGVKKI